VDGGHGNCRPGLSRYHIGSREEILMHEVLERRIAAMGARVSVAERRSGSWARLVRDPAVFAKGAIRHPDHATIELSTWHQVLMNTEHAARAMQHVAFID
jgi:hypothetical protein